MCKNRMYLFFSVMTKTANSQALNISQGDFEIICRCCLNREGKVKLFLYKHKEILLSQIFIMFSSFIIAEDDELPKTVCRDCVDILQQFYQFRKQIEYSDSILREVLVKKDTDNDSIKAEEIQTEENDWEALLKNEDIDSDLEEASEKPEVGLALEADVMQPNPGPDMPKKIKRKCRDDLTCSFCSLKFDTHSEYKAHRKKEADLRRKKHSCPECNKMISTYKLKDHVNSHTKESPYQCDICKEKFRFRSSLTRHKFKHSDKKPHVCPICGRGFIQAPTLTDHLRTHSGKKSFICNVCGKFFVTRHSLANHIHMHRIKASDDPKTSLDRTCKYCDSPFNTMSALKQHMATHCVKDFLCSECGKKFSTKPLLDSHIKNHSRVKLYTCHTCKKGFAQKAALQKHIFTHTGEKPEVCVICDKRFSQKSHLTYHMRKHSGERPYHCSFCSKTFDHTGSLKVHVRIHTGEKPFVCDVCLKGFYDSSSMKKHKKIHEDFTNTAENDTAGVLKEHTEVHEEFINAVINDSDGIKTHNQVHGEFENEMNVKYEELTILE